MAKYPHWWRDTVTIYRKQQSRNAEGKTVTTWRREFLDGCFFGVTNRQVFDGSTLKNSSGLVVRVPGKYEKINKGDIVARGKILDNIPENGNISALSDGVEAFVINTVKDNTVMKNSHYHGSDA